MKKTISFLMVLAFIFSMSISVGAATVSEVGIQHLVEMQAPLISAHQQVFESYNSLSEHRTSTALFKYGGSYIDDEYLHINIVGDIRSASDYFSENCDDPSVLKYHSVNYSYEELVALVNDIVAINPLHVVGIGIDEKNNTVDVSVNKKIIETKELFSVSSKDTFLASVKETIILGLEKNSLKAASTCELLKAAELPLVLRFEAPATSSATSLVGGMVINEGGGSFSSGICGTYTDIYDVTSNVLLTCGHNRSVGDQVYYGSTLIGSVIKQQYVGGTYYDYSLVKITNTSAFTPSNTVRGTAMMYEASSHPVGARVYKYGMNGFAVGTITRTNYASYQSLAGGYIHGLVEVTIESGYVGLCSGGDSGCPIYNGNTFYGTYSADNRELNLDGSVDVHATLFYYSPSYGVNGFNLLS